LVEFSPFRLDSAEGQLWRGDSLIPLRRKALAVLCYLVERPGHLVTTQELLDVVWADVQVTPGTLTQVISELRGVLGDAARSPSFIETVHGRGFRFIAEIEESPRGEAPSRTPISTPAALRRKRWLVGREPELEDLTEALLEADGGQRRIVFVTGEPGIGKTSLLQTFLERLTDDGRQRWVTGGRCVELHGQGETYLPVLEALDRLARDVGPKRIVPTLRRFAPNWLARVPWLSQPDEATDVREPGLQSTRSQMLREFCIAMEALAADHTLVLWLEDLQWSDSASVDLLPALAARPEPARLLVLATYRPTDAAVSGHPIAALKRDLVQRNTARELSLELLDEPAVRDYLRQRFETEPDQALATAIAARSDGNPLFMVTLVEHFMSEGWLEQTKDGWRTGLPLAAPSAAVPNTLSELFENQLARLDAEDLEVLEAASFIGDGFAAQPVAAALDREVVAVEKVCTRLTDTWFLEAVGPGRWPDGSAGERYCFHHVLFRHVLYRRVGAGRGQLFHRRIAERLQAGYASDPEAVAAEVALHFERGGDPERAVECLLLAARGVRQRSGDREAVAYFERGIELLAALPDSDERTRRELELRMHLWREVNASAEISAREQLDSLDRALELCDRIGDVRSRACASSYRTRSLIIECELSAAASLDPQRVERASTLEDPVLLAAAHSEVGDIAFYRGELECSRRAQALSLSAPEGADPRKTCSLLGHDPGTLASGYLAWISWLQGRADEARRHAGVCLARAEAAGYPLNRAFALVMSLQLELFRRDADAANALVASYTALVDEYGFELPYPGVYTAMCGALAQRGEVALALAQLREGISTSRRLYTRQGLSHLLATLAETELGQGQAQPGLAAIKEAEDFVEETGERFWEAEIRRLKGELLWLDGEHGRAEACFATALELARAQGALSLELRAASSLARVRRHAGGGRELRPLLAGIYERFTEAFETQDLRDARKLLDSL
jgi:DNA-binding winged helix-turn-helix (wHTH) protein/tetratricopeptide (TPR) repeat protein